MVTVYDPATFGFYVFSGYCEGKMAHESYEIIVALDDGIEDSEAVVGVVVGDAFDATDDGFRSLIHVVIIHGRHEDWPVA